MNVLIGGVICGIVAFLVLLLLCLCWQSKRFRHLFRLKDKEGTPILQLPHLTLSPSRKQCVQPYFDGTSLHMVPHLTADESDGKDKQQLGGVNPDELRGRLHSILSPVSCGLLDFSLYYDTEAKQLCGVIFCARELPMIQDRLPTVFIQMELICSQRYVHCTPLSHTSSNPVYNEYFQFGPIDINDLIGFGLLRFQAFHTDHVWKEKCLASVDVALSDFSADDLIEDELSICRALIKSDTEPFIRSHQVYSISRSSSTETTLTSTLPRSCPETPHLRETPRFQHRAHSPQIYLTSTTGAKTILEGDDDIQQRPSSALEMTSRRVQSHFPKPISNSSSAMLQLSLLYNREADRLVVIVLKAKDLQLQPSGHPPSVFVKLYVYNTVTHQKTSKKATEIQRRTMDPVFNESFNFRLSENRLIDSQLFISIIDSTEKRWSDYRRMGCIVLGHNVDGDTESKHWRSATHGDGIGKQITMWHVL